MLNILELKFFCKYVPVLASSYVIEKSCKDLIILALSFALHNDQSVFSITTARII